MDSERVGRRFEIGPTRSCHTPPSARREKTGRSVPQMACSPPRSVCDRFPSSAAPRCPNPSADRLRDTGGTVHPWTSPGAIGCLRIRRTPLPSPPGSKADVKAVAAFPIRLERNVSPVRRPDGKAINARTERESGEAAPSEIGQPNVPVALHRTIGRDTAPVRRQFRGKKALSVGLAGRADSLAGPVVPRY